MMSGRSSKHPFTASQWQELEHQVLIFKYMASGTPIPHDLLLPIKGSFYFDSCSSSTPPYPNGGSWGCFQMGFGKKAEDPEPWRCRRTDGKKWRCSKEAYPDSKYCERHMHRGKNRSRKHVEMPIPTSTNTTAAAAAAAASLYPSHQPMASAADDHHVMDPYSASRNAAILGFPIHGSATHFSIDTPASSAYRHSSHGFTEEPVVVLDQYTTAMPMPDSSIAGRERCWQFTPLGMTTGGEERRHGSSRPSLQDQGGGGGGFFPGAGVDQLQEQKEKRQHCFLLGAHMEQEKPPAAVAEGEGEARRPLLHLIDDWPLRAASTREHAWMDAGDQEQPGWGGFGAKTQLSISIPMAHHDLPTAGSRSGAGD